MDFSTQSRQSADSFAPDVEGAPKVFGATVVSFPKEPERSQTPKPKDQIPNWTLGALLDAGKASAYAIHLLAIKIHRFNFEAGALNEILCCREISEGGYGLGRREWQAGIRLLDKAAVIRRKRAGNRQHAIEDVIPQNGRYTLLPTDLLTRDFPKVTGRKKKPVDVRRSQLIAFILVVNLNPEPQTAAEAAKRIGIISPSAIRKLVKVAIELEYVSSAILARGKVLVARKGHEFDLVENVLVENVRIENAPVQRKKGSDRTQPKASDGTQHNENYLQHRTRPDGTRCDDDLGLKKSSEVDPQWITLSDWKLSRFFRENLQYHPRLLQDLNKGVDDAARFMSHEKWRDWMSKLGCPAHLATPSAHRQALEIGAVLGDLGELKWKYQAVEALAIQLASSVRRGNVIRSMAASAEFLFRRLEEGDNLCISDRPTYLSAPAHNLAYERATCFMALFHASNFPADSELLHTCRLEELYELLARYGSQIFERAIKAAIADVTVWPPDKTTICGWTWFEKVIHAISPGPPRAKRAKA